MGSIVNTQNDMAARGCLEEDEESKIAMVNQDGMCDEHAEDFGHEMEILQNARTRVFLIGTPVHVRNYGSGVVRFTGETHFAPGNFIGVELDEPHGKHDGFFDGKRYFQARPNTGVFVRDRRLSAIKDGHPTSPRQKYSFALTLNGGLVTIKSSLKEKFPDDPKIIRYSPRCSKVSMSKLEGKFLAAQVTDDKISKLDLLSWLIEKEYLQLNPRHRRSTSHRSSRSRKRSTNINVKILPENAHRENSPYILVDPGMLQAPSHAVGDEETFSADPNGQQTPSNLSPSVVCLSASKRKHRSRSPKTSSVVCMPSDIGVLSETFGSLDSNQNLTSCRRISTGHSAGQMSIDASEPGFEEYSDSSGDEVCAQVDLLKEEVKHERLMVKRKEERVRELEEELKGYDQELKEKTKSLKRKSKHIEKLEKQCKELALCRDTAVADAEAWQFELLYGTDQHTMMTYNNYRSSVGTFPAKHNIV